MRGHDLAHGLSIRFAALVRRQSPMSRSPSTPVHASLPMHQQRPIATRAILNSPRLGQLRRRNGAFKQDRMEADTWLNLGVHRAINVTCRCTSNVNNQSSVNWVLRRARQGAGFARFNAATHPAETVSLLGVSNSCSGPSSTPQPLDARLCNAPGGTRVLHRKRCRVLVRQVRSPSDVVACGRTGAGRQRTPGLRPACVGVAILDPDLRASFARFDATQSAQAARICAGFFNTLLSGPAPRPQAASAPA